MRPWSEVYEHLRTLWLVYWQTKDPELHRSIQALTNEIVARQEQIRSLEKKLAEKSLPARVVSDKIHPLTQGE